MRLTAEQIFEKLVNEDRILEIQGQIKFYLGDVDIVVKQRDVVGNIMQEWLEGWLIKNNIEYAPSENSQMPPDFFLNPDDLKSELLEVKAFNDEASPGFDIADFKSFQNEIIAQPWMLHSKYLIFGYNMTEDGYVVVKRIWLKNVWELCRPMEKYPLNLQVKNGVVHKIRPGIWWNSTGARRQFNNFETLEDFISAVEETVYRNPDTRQFSGTWLSRFKSSYNEHFNVKLNIPRWNDIEDKYVK